MVTPQFVDTEQNTIPIPNGFIAGWPDGSSNIQTVSEGYMTVECSVWEDYEETGSESPEDDNRLMVSDLTVTGVKVDLVAALASEKRFGAKKRAKQFEQFLIAALNESLEENAAFEQIVSSDLVAAITEGNY